MSRMRIAAGRCAARHLAHSMAPTRPAVPRIPIVGLPSQRLQQHTRRRLGSTGVFFIEVEQAVLTIEAKGRHFAKMHALRARNGIVCSQDQMSSTDLPGNCEGFGGKTKQQWR
jgi:hypothetical protein